MKNVANIENFIQEFKIDTSETCCTKTLQDLITENKKQVTEQRKLLVNLKNNRWFNEEKRSYYTTDDFKLINQFFDKKVEMGVPFDNIQLALNSIGMIINKFGFDVSEVQKFKDKSKDSIIMQYLEARFKPLKEEEKTYNIQEFFLLFINCLNIIDAEKL